MALVTRHAADIEAAWRAGADAPAHALILGVCTIEDVFEELIGEEVLDELDRPITPGEQLISAGSHAPQSRKRSCWEARPTTEAARAAGFNLSDPLLPNSSEA